MNQLIYSLISICFLSVTKPYIEINDVSMKTINDIHESRCIPTDSSYQVNLLEEIPAHEPKVKNWHYTAALGISVIHVSEWNNPSGTNAKNISFQGAIDLSAQYQKEKHPFEMSNEMHYQLGIQKEGIRSSNPIQRLQDDINSLHDLSYGIGKQNTWNINAILRSNTSVFSIYDGNYFKDMYGSGSIQQFASPYELNVAPGVKYQPNSSLRISLSPYSFQLYGIKSNEIVAKGIYITDTSANGQFKNLIYTRKGAELNIWYDKQIKNRLELQYRLGLSSDYFEKFGQNGMLDGLFITKLKLFKNLYLTHRATLKSKAEANFRKPYYNQSLLLSYSLSS